MDDNNPFVMEKQWLQKHATQELRVFVKQ
jgi:hypothetical protein